MNTKSLMFTASALCTAVLFAASVSTEAKRTGHGSGGGRRGAPAHHRGADAGASRSRGTGDGSGVGSGADAGAQAGARAGRRMARMQTDGSGIGMGARSELGRRMRERMQEVGGLAGGSGLGRRMRARMGIGSGSGIGMGAASGMGRPIARTEGGSGSGMGIVTRYTDGPAARSYNSASSVSKWNASNPNNKTRSRENQSLEVENDESHWVGHDRKPSGNLSTNRTETVDNNETISRRNSGSAPSLSTNRTETVDNNETLTRQSSGKSSPPVSGILSSPEYFDKIQSNKPN